MIIVPGLSLADPQAGRMARRADMDIVSLTQFPMLGSVRIESAELIPGDPQRRPVLFLQGLLENLTVDDFSTDEELPLGITKVMVGKGANRQITGFYEFNKEQLDDLVVNRGYFTKDFDLPESLFDLEVEIPVKADLLIIPPDKEDTPPLVFIDIADANSLELNLENTGADFRDLWPPISEEREVEAEVESREAEIKGKIDFNRLEFDDIEFDQSGADFMRQEERESEVETPFAELMDSLMTEDEATEASGEETETELEVSDVYESAVPFDGGSLSDAVSSRLEQRRAVEQESTIEDQSEVEEADKPELVEIEQAHGGVEELDEVEQDERNKRKIREANQAAQSDAKKNYLPDFSQEDDKNKSIMDEFEDVDFDLGS